MGVERTLTYVVEVDGEKTTKELKSIEDYTKRISDLETKRSKAPIGSKKYQKLTKELKETEKGYKMATMSNESFIESMAKSDGIIGTIGQTLLGVGDTFDNLSSQYAKLDNGLASIGNTLTGNVFKGTTKASTGFKLLRGALISTGVGALVVAFGALVAYFTSTEEGSKKLKTAMNALGIIVGRLTEKAAELGGFIVKIFTEPQEAFETFKTEVIAPVKEFFNDLGTVLINKVINSFGNFKIAINSVRAAFNELVGDEEEAAELRKENDKIRQENAERDLENTQTATKYVEKLTDAYKGFKEELEEVTQVANDLETSRRRIRDLEQEIIVTNSKLRGTLEENRKIYDNTNKSFEERRTALEKMNEANERIIAGEIRLNKAKQENLKLQIQEEGDYEKREELQTQLSNLQAQLNDKSREYNNIKQEGIKLGQDLDKQEIDQKTALQEKLRQITTERVDNLREQMLNELTILEEQAIKEIDLLKGTEEQKQAVRDHFNQLRVQGEKDVQAEIDMFLGEILMSEEEKETAALEKEQEDKLKFLEDNIATEEEILAVKAFYADKFADLDRAQGERRAQRNAAALNMLSSSFGQLAGELDETSGAYMVLIKVQQAAALAATGVALANSFEGLGKDIKKGFPANIVAVASTIALIATAFSQFKALTGMNVKKGDVKASGKAKGSRGSYRARGGMIDGPGTGESDSIPTNLSRGESVINARSTSLFKPVLGAINEAGGGVNFNSGGIIGGSEDRLMGILNQTQQPVQAYVVSSEITSQQQLDRQTKQRVRL